MGKGVLGVALEDDGVGTGEGAFDADEAVADFLEGVAVADHFALLALLEAVVLALVHDRHHRVVQQLYFVLTRQLRLADLQPRARHPVH